MLGGNGMSAQLYLHPLTWIAPAWMMGSARIDSVQPRMTDPIPAQLVAELFFAIKMLSGYPVPEVPPPVHRLPRAELEAMICRTACGVKAFYLKGKGVYLDEALDPVHDLNARSILLHELVHHVQGETGKFDTMPDCHGWYAKEYEAYSIQNRYLRWEGSSVNFYMNSGWRDCRNEAGN